MRDRPMEQPRPADEKHKKFDDEKSEFMGYLKLWKWIEEGRGVQRHGKAPTNTSSATASRSSAARQLHQPAPRARVARHPQRSCTPWWPSTAGG